MVELGSFFAAPFGATLLAEQGARVIKVEPPEGDAIRNLMPFPDLAGIKVLHGKESVVLDLDDDADRAVLESLVRGADVVLQGYRAGVAERMRVSADDLHALNPELVYVSSPGYGGGPPCGRKPAFAPTMGAASGLAVRNIGGADCLPVGADLDLDEVKRTSIRLAAGAMGPANADGFAVARRRHRAAARAGRPGATRRRQRPAHVDAVDGRAARSPTATSTTVPAPAPTSTPNCSG